MVHSSGEGVLVSWDQNDAAVHWVAWMNDDEYQAARDAGDWTTALNYAYVPSGDTHVVPAESLIKDDDYWFTVGRRQQANPPPPLPGGAWQSLTAIHGLNGDADSVDQLRENAEAFEYAIGSSRAGR